MDEAADLVAAGDSGPVEIGDGCWERAERSSLIMGPVGSVLRAMCGKLWS